MEEEVGVTASGVGSSTDAAIHLETKFVGGLDFEKRVLVALGAIEGEAHRPVQEVVELGEATGEDGAESAGAGRLGEDVGTDALQRLVTFILIYRARSNRAPDPTSHRAWELGIELVQSRVDAGSGWLRRGHICIDNEVFDVSREAECKQYALPVKPREICKTRETQQPGCKGDYHPTAHIFERFKAYIYARSIILPATASAFRNWDAKKASARLTVVPSGAI